MIQRSVLRTVFKHRLLSNVIITLPNKKPKEFTTEICLKKHQIGARRPVALPRRPAGCRAERLLHVLAGEVGRGPVGRAGLVLFREGHECYSYKRSIFGGF